MAESSHRQRHRVPASCCQLPVSPARGHLLRPGVARPGRTPRLSMQVSLLVGHSQPGPSQPLSHTQAPLEQRPRSARGERHRAAPLPGLSQHLGVHPKLRSPLSPQPTARYSPLCASGWGHSDLQAPEKGAAGWCSPLQRKPEVRGHCRTSYWQKSPSKRCTWPSRSHWHFPQIHSPRPEHTLSSPGRMHSVLSEDDSREQSHVSPCLMERRRR